MYMFFICCFLFYNVPYCRRWVWVSHPGEMWARSSRNPKSVLRKFKMFARDVRASDFNVFGEKTPMCPIPQSKMNDTMFLMQYIPNSRELKRYYKKAPVIPDSKKKKKGNLDQDHNAYKYMTKRFHMNQLEDRCDDENTEKLTLRVPYVPYKVCSAVCRWSDGELAGQRMLVRELDPELTKHGLPKKGNKGDKIKRLRKHIETHHGDHDDNTNHRMSDDDSDDDDIEMIDL